MANFPIQFTERTISGRGPSVRAKIDVRQGDVGRALGQSLIIGGRILKYVKEKERLRLEKIAKKSQEMTDGISYTKAKKLRDLADEEFDTYKINHPRETWVPFRQKQTTGVAEEISKLPFSPDVLAKEQLKAEAYSEVSTAKALTDSTLQLRTDTIEALTESLTDAFRSGEPEEIVDAIRVYKDNGANMGKDKVEVLNDIKAAREAGEKLRANDAINEWQRRIAENPDETAVVLNEELEARGRNEGVIPEEVLPSETIQSLLNTATNRRAQLTVQSNKAFENRKGDETARLSKLLVDGELIEQEIDEIDLGAIGDQKEDEFKWKQNWKKILRDTIKLKEPLISVDSAYDSLVTGSELVERGAKSPAEWEQEFSQAWSEGELTENDRRDLRSKDIVATKTMQNRTFSEATANTRPKLVELRDDELSGLVAARDNALKLKDLKTVNALNFSIKKAQIQKWNFGRYRTELRSQMSQNPDWSQKQIFVAEDILADQFDKDIAQLMLEFEAESPDQSILKTPPDDELNDVWNDLSQEDKAAIWELRMRGAPISEIIGELPNFGLRPTGSKKGQGFLGVLTLPDGSMATEYSIGTTDITGKEMNIPTLVPTLTQKEIDLMVNDIIPNKKRVPDTIIQKAVAHAKKRIKQGKSVFFEQGEL